MLCCTRLWLKVCLWLRYRVRVVPTPHSLQKDDRPVLFVSNLSSQLDPLLAYLAIPTQFRVTPVIPQRVLTVEGLTPLMQRLKAFFLPRYAGRVLEIEKRRYKRNLSELHDQLSQGGSLLVFPEGKLATSPLIELKESPLVADLLTPSRSVRVVVVHIRGMLGSAFSARAKPHQKIPRLSFIFSTLFKNALFFIPRRDVVITFSEISLDKSEDLKTAIEHAFNRPCTLALKLADDGTQFVPYERFNGSSAQETQGNTLFGKHREDILKKLAHLAKRESIDIIPTQHLYEDLNLDSLDVTELVVWIEQRFQVDVTFEGLQTVDDILRAAQGKQRIEMREKEQEKLQERWQSIAERTPAELPQDKQTVLGAFLATCDRMKSEIACASGATLMSYTRLKSLVVGLAEEFKSLPGEKVGVLLPSSVECNAVVLALMMAHKVPTLLNWSQGPKHLDDVVQIAELEAIISSERFLEGLKLDLPELVEKSIVLIEDVRGKLTFKKRHKALQLSRKDAKALLSYLGLSKVSVDDPAVLLFTSGTEKEPKGVLLSHRNLLSNQAGALERIELDCKDVLLGMLPAFHVFGLSLTNLLPLVAGIRAVYYPNPLDCRSIAQQIQQWEVTVLCATPTFLNLLLTVAAPEQLKSVRLFVMGAEKLPQALIHEINTRIPGAQVIEGYGLTECSPILTLNNLYKPHKGVGKPLLGVELTLVHPDTKQPLIEPQNNAGEGLICARGPNVFEGYLNTEKQPFLSLNGHKWFVTGDLGYFDEEGNLFLTGRLSRSIKIAGERISLGTIEHALGQELAAHPDYAALKFAVVEKGEGHLVLFCTQRIELEFANSLLRKAGLSNLLRLKEVKVIASLPLLANGKIDYRSLSK